MEPTVQRIARILSDEDDFLVASHLNPDGDAYGSTVAMGWLLRALGKRFVLYNVSGAPERFDWLPTPSPVTAELPSPLPAWVVTLDCGAAERLGDALAARLPAGRTVTLDHHLGNGGFGDVNWVEVRQPATGAMVAAIARELDVPLTGPLAQSVYLALATDTGFFTYGNTTPETLELVALLMRGGLKHAPLNHKINSLWTLNRMRLWTEVMGSVELFFNGQVAVAAVTRAMFERTGTGAADTDELINFVRLIKGLRVAVLLRQDAADRFKFSLRSFGEDNVQAIAARFGGGGHRNASGGTVMTG
ncbi:MAG: bifunctional oligoribonuclease/PAP phosphatase NrnA, partial [Desulfovibrionaceae bacterium]